CALTIYHRQVLRVDQSRLRGRHRLHRVDQPHRGDQHAGGVVVAVLVVVGQLHPHGGPAGDLDAVAAVAVVGARPVRRLIAGGTGDVLQDDPVDAVDLPHHLEPHGG